MSFRSGHVALIGRPNAGKSTLLNAIVGTRIAAVSPLPQTTRERLFGIHSDDDCQIIFADLPGVMQPTDRLNEVLLENALEGSRAVDVVLHLVDVAEGDPYPREIEEALTRAGAPLVLGLTKLDGKQAKVDPASWFGECVPAVWRDRYRWIHGLSVQRRETISELIARLAAMLPEGPPLYDPEQITDRHLRDLAGEMIREKAFYFLHEELPYSTAVVVEEFKEREHGKWYVRAVLHVERNSQKGMVIGRGGETLKKISMAARKDIETLCDAPVYLELFVKVREKWRRDERALREFGYKQSRKDKR